VASSSSERPSLSESGPLLSLKVAEISLNPIAAVETIELADETVELTDGDDTEETDELEKEKEELTLLLSEASEESSNPSSEALEELVTLSPTPSRKVTSSSQPLISDELIKDKAIAITNVTRMGDLFRLSGLFNNSLATY
jgi:hypothetical protein